MKNSEIKVQAFPISKKLNVNQKVFYSGNKNKPKKEKEDIKINKDFTEMTILEKINYIINLPIFMEDTIVSITTSDGVINQTIVEREGDKVILKNGQKIKIDEIEDITLI
ncbi:MAG TPA: hypothetical protein GX690_03235 [Tenericutes bacterium]|nr:hypothetical protein [Mycoplasmatota bacterium]